MEKLDEMSGKSSKLISTENVRAYYFPNKLTFALFSVSSFVQIKQSQVKLVMQCSIPKSLVQSTGFDGVCLLGIKSIWCHFMESDKVKSVHTLKGKFQILLLILYL